MKNKIPDYPWFKATLSPVARSIFTDSFYPEQNELVYFTQVDITPNVKKVIVAAKMIESSIRMMTLDLAKNCLVPGDKATVAEMNQLNQLVCKLKV